jgi:hypothetical protein
VVEEGPEDEAVLVGGGPGRGRASLGAHRSSRRSFPAAAAGGAGRRWSGAAGPCPWPEGATPEWKIPPEYPPGFLGLPRDSWAPRCGGGGEKLDLWGSWDRAGMRRLREGGGGE